MTMESWIMITQQYSKSNEDNTNILTYTVNTKGKLWQLIH